MKKNCTWSKLWSVMVSCTIPINYCFSLQHQFRGVFLSSMSISLHLIQHVLPPPNGDHLDQDTFLVGHALKFIIKNIKCAIKCLCIFCTKKLGYSYQPPVGPEHPAWILHNANKNLQSFDQLRQRVSFCPFDLIKARATQPKRRCSNNYIAGECVDLLDPFYFV